ncbi:hypothetical protein U1Q18_045116, partial [Sarracenia purpurea var. burkii]
VKALRAIKRFNGAWLLDHQLRISIAVYGPNNHMSKFQHEFLCGTNRSIRPEESPARDGRSYSEVVRRNHTVDAT